MWRIRTTASGGMRAAPLHPDAPPKEVEVDAVRMPAALPERGDILGAGWLLDYDGVRLLLAGAPLSKPNRRLYEAALARHAWGKGDTFRRDHYEADLLALSFAPCVDTGGSGVNIDDEADGGRVFLDAEVDFAIGLERLWRFYACAFFRDRVQFDAFTAQMPLPPSAFFDRAMREFGPDSKPGQLITRDIEHAASHWHVALASVADFDGARSLREALRLYRDEAAEVYWGDGLAFGPYSLEHRLSADAMLRHLGLAPDGRLADGEPEVGGHPAGALSLSTEILDTLQVRPDERLDTALARVRRSGDLETRDLFENAVAHHRAALRWLKLIDGKSADRIPLPFNLYYDDLIIGLRTFTPPSFLGRPLHSLTERGRGTFARVEKGLRKLGWLRNSEPPTVEKVLRAAGDITVLPGVGRTSRENLLLSLFQGFREWAEALDRGQTSSNPEARREVLEGLDELEGLFGWDDEG